MIKDVQKKGCRRHPYSNKGGGEVTALYVVQYSGQFLTSKYIYNNINNIFYIFKVTYSIYIGGCGQFCR